MASPKQQGPMLDILVGLHSNEAVEAEATKNAAKIFLSFCAEFVPKHHLREPKGAFADINEYVDRIRFFLQWLGRSSIVFRKAAAKYGRHCVRLAKCIKSHSVLRDQSIAKVLAYWTAEEARLRKEFQAGLSAEQRRMRDRRMMDRLAELSIDEEAKVAVVRELYFRERAVFNKQERQHIQKVRSLRQQLKAVQAQAQATAKVATSPTSSPRQLWDEMEASGDSVFAAAMKTPSAGSPTKINKQQLIFDPALVKEIESLRSALESLLQKTPKFVFSKETISVPKLLAVWKDMPARALRARLPRELSASSFGSPDSVEQNQLSSPTHSGRFPSNNNLAASPASPTHNTNNSSINRFLSSPTQSGRSPRARSPNGSDSGKPATGQESPDLTLPSIPVLSCDATACEEKQSPKREPGTTASTPPLFPTSVSDSGWAPPPAAIPPNGDRSISSSCSRRRPIPPLTTIDLSDPSSAGSSSHSLLHAGGGVGLSSRSAEGNSARLGVLLSGRSAGNHSPAVSPRLSARSLDRSPRFSPRGAVVGASPSHTPRSVTPSHHLPLFAEDQSPRALVGSPRAFCASNISVAPLLQKTGDPAITPYSAHQHFTALTVNTNLPMDKFHRLSSLNVANPQRTGVGSPTGAGATTGVRTRAHTHTNTLGCNQLDRLRDMVVSSPRGTHKTAISARTPGTGGLVSLQPISPRPAPPGPVVPASATSVPTSQSQGLDFWTVLDSPTGGGGGGTTGLGSLNSSLHSPKHVESGRTLSALGSQVLGSGGLSTTLPHSPPSPAANHRLAALNAPNGVCLGIGGVGVGAPVPSPKSLQPLSPPAGSILEAESMTSSIVLKDNTLIPHSDSGHRETDHL